MREDYAVEALLLEDIERLQRRVQELENQVKVEQLSFQAAVKQNDVMQVRVQELERQLCEERRKRRTWIGWPAERTEED